MVIELAGKPINQGPLAAFDKPLQRVGVLVGDTPIGIAAYELQSAEPAKALFVNRSVLVETVTLDDCNSGFVAIVHVDLPMDLSQHQILRDVAWAEVMTAIRTAHASLPRPRLDVGGPATEAGGPRPWRTAVLATAAVLALAVVLGFVVRAIVSRMPPNPRQLRHACEQRDRDACARLIEQTVDPERLRALWRLSCEAGEPSHCMLHALEVYAIEPKRGLAMLIEVCEDGLLDACERALPLAGEHPAATLMERSLCLNSDHEVRVHCRAWIDDLRATCGGSPMCLDLREALDTGCKQAPREFCLEAGVMAHFGYGGPRHFDTAKRLFERGCMAGSERACEWSERPAVSERSCNEGDGLACYALGIEARYWRARLGEASQRFERACELNLAAGCHAVGLAHVYADGVERDLQKADRWFARACELGSSVGCQAREFVARLQGQPAAKLDALERVGPPMVLPGITP
jgi:hypothetical protein